jgi:hypothetical protein
MKIENPVAVSRKLGEEMLRPLEPHLPIDYRKADQVISMCGREGEIG